MHMHPHPHCLLHLLISLLGENPAGIRVRSYLTLLSFDAPQAYVLDFDLYVFNLTADELVALTSDGRENEVYNGIPDWVYEGTTYILHCFKNTHIRHLHTGMYVCM